MIEDESQSINIHKFFSGELLLELSLLVMVPAALPSTRQRAIAMGILKVSKSRRLQNLSD